MVVTDEWFDAAKQLVTIAADRKAQGLEPWNDPSMVRQILVETENHVNRTGKSMNDTQKAIANATHAFERFIALLTEQSALLDKEARVNDSVSSSAELTLRFEKLFVATMGILEQTASSVESSGNLAQGKAIREALRQMAQGFKYLLDELNRRHGILIEIRYLIAM